MAKVLIDNENIRVVHHRSDAKDFECEFCGKTNIGNLYDVTNKADDTTIAVGNVCVKKFTALPSWDAYVEKAKGIIAALPFTGTHFLLKVPYAERGRLSVIPGVFYDKKHKANVVSFKHLEAAKEAFPELQIHSKVKTAYEAFLAGVTNEADTEVVESFKEPAFVLEMHPGGLSFRFPFNGPLKDALKELGARFNGSTTSWEFPTLAGVNGNKLGDILANLPECFNWSVPAGLENRVRALGENKPKATVTKVGESLTFLFPFNNDLKDAIKGLGGRFNGLDKSWTIANLSNSTPVNLDRLVNLLTSLTQTYSKFNWEFIGFQPEDLRGLAEAKKLESEEKAKIKAGAEQTVVDTSHLVKGITLFPYQRVGLAFQNYVLGNPQGAESPKHGVLIGDDMGLGKTIQAIAYFSQNPNWRVAVVCPGAVKYNWLNEAKKFAGWEGGGCRIPH